MKILWIVNSVLNDLSMHLYKRERKAVWIDALLEDFKLNSEYEIVVATTLPTKSTIKHCNDGITYYALPDNYPTLYNENRKENIKAWKKLLKEENPDIIQVWGTEFTHGLCALRQSSNTPSIIYMQGLLSSIAKYYHAGIELKEIKKNRTFRDIIKRDGILSQQKKYYKSSLKEREMLNLSRRIISENEWCNYNVKSVIPDIKTYDLALSINKVFSKKKWDINNIERHSIMCTASGYTIKGLHMVLKATALLKDKYPDIKVYVPGTPMVSDGSLKGNLKKGGYVKYIETLIKELGIKDNVVWMGYVSQDELASRYEKTHLFVMSSSIENHSSSLKEAMIVGMPCISSAVGGIPEYVKHGENGLLYRFEEYQLMAGYVEKIFDDDDLAKTLSKRAREDMMSLHEGKDLYKKMINIYQEILRETK